MVLKKSAPKGVTMFETITHLLSIKNIRMRNAINMHLTCGETFTCAQEVTECFVSVGNRRCFDHDRPV